MNPLHVAEGAEATMARIAATVAGAVASAPPGILPPDLLARFPGPRAGLGDQVFGALLPGDVALVLPGGPETLNPALPLVPMSDAPLEGARLIGHFEEAAGPLQDLHAGWIGSRPDAATFDRPDSPSAARRFGADLALRAMGGSPVAGLPEPPDFSYLPHGERRWDPALGRFRNRAGYLPLEGAAFAAAAGSALASDGEGHPLDMAEKARGLLMRAIERRLDEAERAALAEGARLLGRFEALNGAGLREICERRGVRSESHLATLARACVRAHLGLSRDPLDGLLVPARPAGRAPEDDGPSAPRP